MAVPTGGNCLGLAPKGFLLGQHLYQPLSPLLHEWRLTAGSLLVRRVAGNNRTTSAADPTEQQLEYLYPLTQVVRYLFAPLAQELLSVLLRCTQTSVAGASHCRGCEQYVLCLAGLPSA